MMGMRFRPALKVNFLALIFFFILLTPLLPHLQPNVQTANIAEPSALVTEPMEARPLGRYLPGRRHLASLTWTGPETWHVQNIDLKIGTYLTRPLLLKAVIVGPKCRLSAPWWASIYDNMHLRFAANGDCELRPGDVLDVKISTLRAPHLTLLAHKPEDGFLLAKASRPDEAVVSIVQGEAVSAGEQSSELLRRYEALAMMWALPAWLFLLMVALVGAATAFFLARRVSMALGYVNLETGLVVFSVATFYALISPPFQGPDEARHFNSYLLASGQQERISDVTRWLGELHYARVNCDVSACLSDVDMKTPSLLKVPPYVTPLDIEKRSALAEVSVKTLTKILADVSTKHQLFWLRILNSLAAGLLAAASCAMFFGFNSPQASSNKSLRIFLVVFCAIPTLGFLVMNASNNSYIVAANFCLIASLVIASRSAKAPYFSAVLWCGVLVAVLALAGRSGLAAAAMLGLVSCGWFLLGNRSAVRALASLTIFGGGLLLALQSASNTVYYAAHYEQIRRVVFKLPRAFGVEMTSINNTALLFFAAFVLFAIFRNAFLNTSRRLFKDGRDTVRWIHCAAVLVALSSVLLLVWPLVFSTPTLPDIEYLPHEFTRPALVLAVLQTFWLNLGITGQDFFIHSSLWTGLGCPDRAVPNFFVQCIKFLVVFGLGAALTLRLWRRQWSQFLSVLVTVVISVVWMSVIAFSLLNVERQSGINPHGRYFIGPGILLLVTALSEIFAWFSQRSETRARLLASLIAMCGLGAANWFWLERFFR